MCCMRSTVRFRAMAAPYDINANVLPTPLNTIINKSNHSQGAGNTPGGLYGSMEGGKQGHEHLAYPYNQHAGRVALIPPEAVAAAMEVVAPAPAAMPRVVELSPVAEENVASGSSGGSAVANTTVDVRFINEPGIDKDMLSKVPSVKVIMDP